MKALALILLFTGMDSLTFGQVSADSLIHKVSATSNNLNADSLQQKLLSLPDTLLPSLGKIDSLRHNFNLAADSIQTKYQKTVSAIEAQTSHLTKRIDSLQHLNLSTTRYTQSLDSLNQHRLTITSKLQSRLDSLKSKTIGKITALDLPPEYKKPLEDLTKKLDKLNLNSDNPRLFLAGYQCPTRPHH